MVNCSKVSAMMRPIWNRKIQPVQEMDLKKHVAWANNSKEASSKRGNCCGKSMREYLDNSTLHGLKYIGYTQITIFERYSFNEPNFSNQ